MIPHHFPKRDKVTVRLLSQSTAEVHSHRDIEVLFVLQGILGIDKCQEQINLSAGEFYIVNSRESHALFGYEDVRYLSISLNYELIRDVVQSQEIFFRNDLTDEVSRQELISLINQLLRYYLEKTSQEVVDFAYLSLCYAILNCLSKHFLERDGQTDVYLLSDSDKEDRMSRISHYLNVNYDQAITLQTLSEYLYLSPTYLSKYFKRVYGVNFKKYLTFIRLEHSLDDVLNSTDSMTSIAYGNGFPNVTTFRKSFQEKYGIWPEDLREQDTNTQSLSLSETEKVLVENYLITHTEPDQTRVKAEHSVINTMPLPRHYQTMINVGAASDILSSEMQKHLLLMKRRMGIEYVRFWNVLSEELLIGSIDGDVNFNFTKLNLIFDFLVTNHLKPHIELSEKVKTISRTAKQSVSLYNSEKQLSLHQFQEALKAFLKHFINRYGLKVVEEWRFELWLNEWIVDDLEDVGTYFEKYQVVYNQCKYFSPNIKVGGCGVHSKYSTHLTIEFWEKWAFLMKRPDFISMASYAYTHIDGNDEHSSVRSQEKSVVSKRISALKNILTSIGWMDLPVYVSEWNLTFSERNYINDTCFKGAYILETVFQNMDTVLGYHFLSDQLSESFDSSELLYGGLGLISKDSIFKPAAHAYGFLNDLSEDYFGRSDNYLMTTDNNDNYTILCHNKQDLTNLYFATQEDQIDLDKLAFYFNTSKKQFHFVLKDVAEGKYKLKIKRISPENGSLLTEWQKLGYYKDLSVHDIRYLQGRSIPTLDILEITSKDNKLDFDLCLDPNEFVLIKLKKI